MQIGAIVDDIASLRAALTAREIPTQPTRRGNEGEFDAYHNPPFTSADADRNRARDPDVMLNFKRADTQVVYSYNIGMMLYAFRDSMLQNYGNTRTGEESQVFFRSDSLS